MHVPNNTHGSLKEDPLLGGEVSTLPDGTRGGDRSSHRRIGILGYGEIGQSIERLYPPNPYATDEILIKDLDRDDFVPEGKKQGDPLDILHICIPYTKNFIDIVRKEMLMHCPMGLTIIHSTVPVGTTEMIWELTPTLKKHVVHSPVRGKHPNLTESLKTFVKYIGSDFPTPGCYAAEHFAELGVKTQVLWKARTTELLKLLDTTYYAHAIAYHEYAKKLCDEADVNFEHVMTHANNSYNEGYMKMGHPEYIRPILSPPEGRIGGHCLMPNVKLLEQTFGYHPIIEHLKSFDHGG